LRLSIMVTDDLISPDADPAIYASIDLKLDIPAIQAQGLAVDLAQYVIDYARKENPEDKEKHDEERRHHHVPGREHRSA
jgi:hypothetical protein